MDINHIYQTESQITKAIENYNTRLNTDISPNDQMHSHTKETYLFQTRSAFECIINALKMHEECRVKSILDFGCGHGRVLRGLRAAFPNAEIVASDINADGVNYCAEVFDSVGIVSKEDPGSINLDKRKFDLIWVGSVFTHLDSKNTRLFFNLLKNHLNENGILVCTFHGRFSEERLNNGVGYGEGLSSWKINFGYRLFGYGYCNYLNNNNYGISISKPSWVLKELVEPNTDLTLLYYCERGWDKHQDVLAVTHTPIKVPHDIQKERWRI